MGPKSICKCKTNIQARHNFQTLTLQHGTMYVSNWIGLHVHLTTLDVHWNKYHIKLTTTNATQSNVEWTMCHDLYHLQPNNDTP
jgi:hypothetical protein